MRYLPGLLSFAVVLLALAGAILSFSSYVSLRVAVPNVAALAPPNQNRTASAVVSNVHPPGDPKLVALVVEAEQAHAALLHDG